MRRIVSIVLFFLAASAISSSVEAAERKISATKKKLIRQLLEVTDAPEGAADAIIDILGGRLGLPIASEEARGEVRESRQVEAVAEETQLELYDRYFTEKQLRQLIAFFKTETGEHYVKVARAIAAETRKNLQAATNRRLEETAEKARVDRARNDLQAIGLALKNFFADHSTYPKAQNIDELAALLEPKYTTALPRQDAWGHPFRYEASTDGQHYRVASGGADGKFVTPGDTGDDIVISDGRLQQ